MANKTSVALGYFDGLHKGHMKILHSALSSSGDGVEPYVLLFDRHPQTVVGKTGPSSIMTKDDRDSILSGMGFKIITLPFEDIHKMSPEEFVEEILFKKLNAKTVCCGFNYRFGKNASGDSKTLSELCKNFGIETVVESEQRVDGETVSSTKIRSLIEDGNITLVNKLLGRPFGYTLEVIHGNKNGRLLGFPTVNQAFPENFTVPKYGVYASNTTVDGKIYRSITNIGIRPTLSDDTLLSETHIIGFDRDLYGEKIKVELLKFIRSERKFNSLEEVFTQVKEDIKIASK